MHFSSVDQLQCRRGKVYNGNGYEDLKQPRRPLLFMCKTYLPLSVRTQKKGDKGEGGGKKSTPAKEEKSKNYSPPYRLPLKNLHSTAIDFSTFLSRK